MNGLRLKLGITESFASRNTVHVLRRLWHLSTSVTMAYIYWMFFTKEQALLILTTLGTVLLLGDSFRLKYETLNQAILKVLGKLMRKCEIDSQSAMVPFILSLFIVLIVFPKPIVILAILYLGVGDPVASIIGIYYGKTKIFGTQKSLEGLLANFFISINLTFFVLSAFGLGKDAIIPLSLIGGLGSAVSEALPLTTDDNLHVPIISASVIWLALTLLA